MKTKTTAQFLPQVCTELQTIIIMRLLTVSRLAYYSSTPKLRENFNPKILNATWGTGTCTVTITIYQTQKNLEFIF